MIENNVTIFNVELGNILIDKITGQICCDKLNYNVEKMYNDFPVKYNMKDFEIPYLEEWDFTKSDDIINENLHFVLGIREKIEEKIIKEIWDWFVINDYTIEEVKQKFEKLEIDVTLQLKGDKNIDFTSTWEFVEEHSDINSGYADFYLDFESNEIKKSDIGFFLNCNFNRTKKVWFFDTIKEPTQPGGLINELYTINRKKESGN